MRKLVPGPLLTVRSASIQYYLETGSVGAVYLVQIAVNTSMHHRFSLVTKTFLNTTKLH